MTIHRTYLAAAVASLIFCAAQPALADNPMPADQSTTTTTTVTKRHYVYYPEHDIYFAPESKTYYWQSNGNWISGTTLPPGSPVLLTNANSLEKSQLGAKANMARVRTIAATRMR